MAEHRKRLMRLVIGDRGKEKLVEIYSGTQWGMPADLFRIKVDGIWKGTDQEKKVFYTFEQISKMLVSTLKSKIDEKQINPAK